MSTMRLSGLVSGMDTESMVKQLMQYENTKVDKLKQQKEKLEWKRDGYRSVNTLLLNFRNSLTNMKLSTSYRARTTTSSDESRVTATANTSAGIGSFNISQVKQLASSANRISGAISTVDNKIDTKASLKNSNALQGITWEQGSVESAAITADKAGTDFYIKADKSDAELDESYIQTASVKVGSKSYKVVTGDNVTAKEGEVHLSKEGKLTFKDTLTAGSSIKINYIAENRTDNLSISKGATSFNLSKGSIENIEELTINGKSYVLSGDNLIEDVLKGGDSSIVLGTIDKKSGKVTLTKPVDEAVTGTATFTQNFFTTSMTTETSTGTKTENFIFDGTKSLNDVVSAVNSSPLGVSMFFDEYTQKMTMNRTEQGNYGTGDQIKFGDNFFIDTLKFRNDATVGGTVDNGQNSVFTINGLETQRNSNTFSLNGVTFTLKQTFNETMTVVEAQKSSGQVTVGINNDANKVVENVKKFVEEYNTLIAAINKLTTESIYRDYAPLTETERENLSEKQVEQWESKAKSGLLRNDTMLTSVLSAMRLDFSTPVNNSGMSSNFNQLAKIGIKTTANYLEGGKLEIDETTLLKAIEEDPAGVEALFNVNGDSNGSRGIIQRLYDTVNTTMTRITERAGSALSASNSTFTLGKELTSIEKRITSFEDRLKTIEDRYWKQFSAMEKAISNANAQSTQISSMFTSGS